jgi:hypothetical protein
VFDLRLPAVAFAGRLILSLGFAFARWLLYNSVLVRTVGVW